MSAQLTFTSYKGAFQVIKGGPLVYFDAMWPTGKWREGFERVFGGTNWEAVDSDIHFVELIGHTSDGKATWLVGDDKATVPACSTIVRHKGIVALNNPAEKEVIDTLKQQLSVATATTTRGAAVTTNRAQAAGTSNNVVSITSAKKVPTSAEIRRASVTGVLDDFPVVFSV